MRREHEASGQAAGGLCRWGDGGSVPPHGVKRLGCGDRAFCDGEYRQAA